MADLGDIARRVADLHEPGRDQRQTLESVVAFACRALRSDLAGVMLAHADGSVESVAVTDDLIVRADDIQRSLNEGPCLSAFEDEDHVELISDTAQDPRWPRWGPAVSEIGIHSVLSVRLEHREAGPVGSLNVYNRAHEEFNLFDVEVALILARHASVALGAARSEAAAQRALATRTSIGQAEGILMERYRFDEERAFAVLRRYSQASNMPLREVARRLIEDRKLPSIPGSITWV
jgi:GAF domain-containing protein